MKKRNDNDYKIDGVSCTTSLNMLRFTFSFLISRLDALSFSAFYLFYLYLWLSDKMSCNIKKQITTVFLKTMSFSFIQLSFCFLKSFYFLSNLTTKDCSSSLPLLYFRLRPTFAKLYNWPSVYLQFFITIAIFEFWLYLI